MPHFTHPPPTTPNPLATFHTNLTTIKNWEQQKTWKLQYNKNNRISLNMNDKSNQTCLISAALGERERGVSAGSGEALVGSTQIGAVRESGHGRGTPRGGTGRSYRGAFSSLCFDFFSSSCPINLSSPPPFQLS